MPRCGPPVPVCEGLASFCLGDVEMAPLERDLSQQQVRGGWIVGDRFLGVFCRFVQAAHVLEELGGPQ